MLPRYSLVTCQGHCEARPDAPPRNPGAGPQASVGFTLGLLWLLGCCTYVAALQVNAHRPQNDDADAITLVKVTLENSPQ